MSAGHTSGDWADEAERLAAEAIAAGDPTGWFEPLYAAGAAGDVTMPWDRDRPNRMLEDWVRTRGLTGGDRPALVVGCGVGVDAEFVAGLGFTTVAFDVADTAIRLARERNPQSTVRYLTANLLEPPAEWTGAFDLVVEVFTVQALPQEPRAAAIASVARMVARGGTLIVVAARRVAGRVVDPPPWPLNRVDIDAFAADGLIPVAIEELVDPSNPTIPRWRAEFRRP